MQSFKDIDESREEIVSADRVPDKNGRLVPVQRKTIKKDDEKEEMKEARLPVTHEDPLVTVHDKHGLHTHANLSVANRIMQTKVKHTDVHKGPVKVKSGGSYGNVTFAISQHHAKDVVKEETHRVSVTITDPHHPASTLRSVKHEKRIRVNADSKENAVASAIAHYKKRGYKVHDQNYIGLHTEEVECQDDDIHESAKGYKPGWMLKADPALAKKLKDKIDLAKKRQATYGDKSAGTSVKEDLDEGMQQTLRKYVPGYAKKQIDKKMDAEKFGKNGADKDANFWRYKKVQDKLKKEEVELDESDKAWAAAQEKEKEKKLTPNDQDKLAKVRALMAKERQQKEEVEHIDEAISKEDMRMFQLARLGLVDKSDVTRLRLAVQQLKSEKQLSIVQRTLLLRVLEDLMSLVTGDDQIFMRIKRDVQKEEVKNDLPFDGPYKKVSEPHKDKFGNIIKTKNVARHLARLAMQKQQQKQVNK